MRIDGKLKTWNDERGFGFIETGNGGQDIFVHIKAFWRGAGKPQVGQIVTFEIEMGPAGKKRATKVEVVRAQVATTRKRIDSPSQWGTASFFAIPAFFVVFTVVSIAWHVPRWVAGLYFAASVISYLAYVIDKRAATSGAWRISEGTLLTIGLAGGWPGAIVAQQLLRHKSSKASFRSAFWGTVLLNVGGFVTIFSPLLSLIRA